MKYFSVIILAFAFQSAFAQPVIQQKGCSNEQISAQADSIKNVFTTDGFSVLRESFISMESGYEMPVIVPLNKGEWYHVVFIGMPTARLFEMRIYDTNDNQITYEKQLGKDDKGNIISVSFKPEMNTYYMFKVLQMQKKMRDMCGYILLMKRTSTGS